MTSKFRFVFLLNCIVVVLSDIKLLCLKIIFPNVIKSKEFQYPSIVFLSIYKHVYYITNFFGTLYT